MLVNPISKSKLDLGSSQVFKDQTAQHDSLELKLNVAIRPGELAVRGWKIRATSLPDIIKNNRAVQLSDLTPNIQQKGVDLRIGLDIARLSLQKLVDTIVVVTGDSDMVPALKFARREGIRVYLDHMGGPVLRSLKAHVDVVMPQLN